MHVFQLLHLTDLHLAEPDNGGLLQDWIEKRFPAGDLIAAREVAVCARRFFREVDAILVTGDLAHTGRLRDLWTAHQHCVGQEERGRPTFAGVGPIVHLLPGNHDRHREKTRLPGGTHFDQVFADYWDVGYGVRQFSLCGGGEELVVICADFCLQTPLHSLRFPWSAGKAYEAIVKSLGEASTSARNRGAVAIWALHFPPGDKVFEEHIEEKLRLIDWEPLLKVAAVSDVRAILAGHIHECVTYSLSSTPGVDIFCADAATPPDSPPGFCLLSARVDHGNLRRLDFLPCHLRDGELMTGMSCVHIVS